MRLLGLRAAGSQTATDPRAQQPSTELPAQPSTVPSSLPTHEALNVREVEREAAIAELFETHYGSLLRLAVLLSDEVEAEDLVAEAFCELHRKWHGLRDRAAATAYLRATVANLARMGIRGRRRWRRALHRESLQRVDYAASAEQQVLLRDDQHAILAALRTLPRRQREALVLRYWLDLSEAEIAAVMQISTGAVKTHTARGRAALKDALKEVDS